LAKVRADQLLVTRGLAESRTRAQALIMAGAVFSGERRLSKAGEMLAEDSPLETRGKDHPWVSRGGVKLEHGLTHFGFDVSAAAEWVSSQGWRVLGVTESPITGPEGNFEYLLGAEKIGDN